MGFDFKLLDSEDTNSIFVTCKDYNTVRGVATQLHNQLTETGDQNDGWYVKGPMGLGLEMLHNGPNFVFAGGTGILVYLDLVAKIVISLCDGKASEFGDQFKLVLFYTAPSEKEAIGIELLR